MSWVYIIATSLSALYGSLDPSSVAQHFAFYELYPNTKEGEEALRHAWSLLNQEGKSFDPELVLPTIDIQEIVELVNRSDEKAPILSSEHLAVIEKLSSHLLNRKLKGFQVAKQEELLALDPNEIDLARGLLLAELGEEQMAKIRSYEASIDLMALQIQARFPKEAKPLEKIRVISDYIFSEMRFRFPPQSLHAKDIDVYTFLPSVLDSRRGVCLGVSILYLCLAQRLGVELEAITPPGHIYVRHVSENQDILNIETTARGIDVPSEMYLGIETRSLQKRNLKQIIGLAFMNQASVFWHKQEPEKAVALYEKARPFLGEKDYLLNMFLGFNYLFIGKEEEGRRALQNIRSVVPDHAITSDSVSEDYLAGLTDKEAIAAIYQEVDQTRESIIKKQKKLEEIVQKHPKFRGGYFHLAITWLQLGREKEALPILEKYIQMNPQDPTVHYYMAAIHFQRRNFNQSWRSLLSAEKIVFAKNHRPKALKELRMQLERCCPAPA